MFVKIHELVRLRNILRNKIPSKSFLPEKSESMEVYISIKKKRDSLKRFGIKKE